MAQTGVRILNLEGLEKTQVRTEPFPFLVVPDFLNAELSNQVQQDFPKVDFPGSVPLSDLDSGPVFAQLVQELEGEALRTVIGRKFNIDLTNRPTLITVRGRTRKRDGRIHTDTKSKMVTLLLYFNPEWNHEGGRLRMLRSGTDLEDYAEEISPEFGTCIIFKVTDNCWHGHKPYEGKRRAIQLNYLTDEAALKQHLSKHHFSATVKGIKRWFSKEDEY